MLGVIPTDAMLICVTKPQAVIAVATAPLETLAWSGHLGTLWQTKSTFSKFHLKNASFNVFSQRLALKTLITQGLHDFGKPPQPLCLHTLQKRTTLKLHKARSRDVKTLLPNMFAKQQRYHCLLHFYYTALIFSSSRIKRLPLAWQPCVLVDAFHLVDGKVILSGQLHQLVHALAGTISATEQLAQR